MSIDIHTIMVYTSEEIARMETDELKSEIEQLVDDIHELEETAELYDSKQEHLGRNQDTVFPETTVEQEIDDKYKALNTLREELSSRIEKADL